MLPDILIPTCRSDFELSDQIGAIIQADPDIDGDRIIYSCRDASAAVNRNYCLNLAHSKIVVMIDDDISGFFPGWAEKLVAPFEKNSDIVMVSARLMNEDGSPQKVMGFSDVFGKPTVEIRCCPSAAIAFRNDGLRFDENYKGSGWEDSDFIRQLVDPSKGKYPNGKIVVNNEVRLVHKNEMKNQLGENYKVNREHFLSKWKTEW